MPLVCPAAEIVSWKVPLCHYAPEGLESQGIVRLRAAPEDSPFFKKGDALWNLMGIPENDEKRENIFPGSTAQTIRTSPPLEWALWNASSGRLVIKGEWISIWQLHQLLRMNHLPKQLRLTAEALDVPADGAPLSAKSMPAATLSWVVRSGQNAKAFRQQDSSMIRIESEAVSLDDDSLIDLRVVATCSLRDLPPMEVNCGISLQPGNPCWVARDFDGTKGMDLKLSGRIELVDGTPVEDAFLIQKGKDAAQPFKTDRYATPRSPIGTKGWLSTTWVKPEDLRNWLPIEGKDPFKDMDPFKDVDPFAPDIIRTAYKLEVIKVPDNLRTWLPQTVWDLRARFKNLGIGTKDTDFVGYDLVSQRICFFSEDPSTLDQFEQVLSPGCRMPPRLIAISLEGDGQSRLVMRSGEKGLLTLSRNEKIVRSLEIEPVFGGTDDLIDLRLNYVDELNPLSRQSLNSAATLRVGQTSILLDGMPAKGMKPLRAKAVILSPFE